MKLETYVESMTIFDRSFEVPADIDVVGHNIIKFVVMLERDEDGFIVASCPALPGCHSQGRTKEEAIANIKEAIRGYIASMRKHREPLPETDVEEVEVAV